MSINPILSQIDFDVPEEKLVMRAIFWNAKSNELRGFFDVFSKEQIMRMWYSESSKHWTQHSRDWLVGAVDKILSQELN